MKKLFSFILALALLMGTIHAQTSSNGNYEVYTYEASRNGFSYLTMDVNFPDYLGYHKFTQKGIMYTYQYFSGEIGGYNFNNDFRVRFITEGNFNIGAAYGTTAFNHDLGNALYREEVKLYTAKLDFYSLDIATEATYVFKNGIGLTAKFGMNIISIGASVGFPDKGRVKDDLFGVANLVPLIFKPQFLVDFGQSVIGIGFVIHTKNFVGYKYVPDNIFRSDDKGIVFNDNFIADYAIQFLFSY